MYDIRHGLRKDEQGTSSLEFILVLPLVWIVLVLTAEFASAWLSRNRAEVAIREVGLRHVAGISATCACRAGGLRTAIEAAVQKQILTRAVMSAPTFTHAESDFTDSLNAGSIGKALSPFLSALSTTQSYSLSVRHAPLFGTLLRGGQVNTAFVVDGFTWNYYEQPGGYLGILLRKFRLNRLASWLDVNGKCRCD